MIQPYVSTEHDLLIHKQLISMTLIMLFKTIGTLHQITELIPASHPTIQNYINNSNNMYQQIQYELFKLKGDEYITLYNKHVRTHPTSTFVLPLSLIHLNQDFINIITND
eukprot:UN05625